MYRLGLVGVACILIIPHLLRNWWLAGNPIYPALLDRIGGVGVSSWWLENWYFYGKSVSWQERLRVIFSDLGSLSSFYVLCAWWCLLGSSGKQVYSRYVKWVSFGVLFGYYMAWVLFLVFPDTPNYRYLFPVLSYAILVYGGVAEAWWREGSWGGLFLLLGSILLAFLFFSLFSRFSWVKLLVGVVGLIFCTVLSILGRRWRVSSFLNGVVVLGGYLLFVGVFTLALICFVPISQAARGMKSLLVSGEGVRFWGLVGILMVGWYFYFVLVRKGRGGRFSWFGLGSGVVMVVLIFLFFGASWRGLYSFEFSNAKDLVWMNRNLPEDAVILTLETRLFLLKRRFIPGDDPRLERFYRAESLEASYWELRRLGVTHIYTTMGFDQKGPWIRKRFLWPSFPNYIRFQYKSRAFLNKEKLPPFHRNPYLQLLYFRDFSVISQVKLVDSLRPLERAKEKGGR
ncbi:MAG: hypothetical protein D6805_04370 [Planctomycetota bacterium]|nr:MAG: hypothetical protein D6805_04370 [Planctomycetota bacterium]